MIYFENIFWGFITAILTCLFFALFFCGNYENESIAIRPNESKVEIYSDCSNSDSTMIMNITRVNFNHINPGYYNRNKNRYPIDSLNYDSIDISEFRVAINGNINKLKYYSISESNFIIERLIMLDTIISSNKPSVFDSIEVVEYYYFSEDCCIREQLSKGCANIVRTSINSELCKRRIEEMTGFLMSD